MDLQGEYVGGSETNKTADDRLLVMVVGEHIDTGIVVLETFLEDLAKSDRRVVILLAKRKKVFAAPDDGQLQKGYEYLQRKASGLGIEVERRFSVTRDPYGEVYRMCAELVKESPNAVFCFIGWGIEEGKPNLMLRLGEENIRTITLYELLKPLRKGM